MNWLPTLAELCGVERPGGREAAAVLRGTADEALPRFWQLNQFQPVGWINVAMRDGPWKLVRPQLAQRPKTDADKRVMERYV